MAKIEDIVKQIEELNVLEVSELVKMLEDKFGVSAAAPVAVAAAPAAGESAEAEEKSAYNVVITNAGDKKINVIKAIRSIKPDLGLKEAKDLTDSLPATVAENVKADDAKEMKATLEEAGATVELQ